jgi:hypothetical protein
MFVTQSFNVGKQIDWHLICVHVSPNIAMFVRIIVTIIFVIMRIYWTTNKIKYLQENPAATRGAPSS